jgi:hypothetical protein
VAITTSVTSNLAQSFLVSVEIYDAAEVRVHRQRFDNEAFAAGVERQFTVARRLPAATPPGQYMVKIGIYTPGGSALLAWNNAAATITVT